MPTKRKEQQMKKSGDDLLTQSLEQYATEAKQAAERAAKNIEKYLKIHREMVATRNMKLHLEEAVLATEEIEDAAKEAAEKIRRYSALRSTPTEKGP